MSVFVGECHNEWQTTVVFHEYKALVIKLPDILLDLWFTCNCPHKHRKIEI